MYFFKFEIKSCHMLREELTRVTVTMMIQRTIHSSSNHHLNDDDALIHSFRFLC